MSPSHQRAQVLSLYRQILRLSRTWNAASGSASETKKERTYIRDEAKKLFREHKNETSEEKIKEFIREGETRLGLAQHYGTPYPRLMNIPQNVLPFKGSPKFKKDKRVMQQATPIYLKSYSKSGTPGTGSGEESS
ncbi:lyr motif containing protein 1 [Plakobranchus ocellatus]|uniref:Lyr motif containing protein 1 n=1 Tax=Plakobranchus ocellatus TaxID=259542 RepID=A0AAV4CKE4_9GAST|nr:lyr motif containing protein 1 [Plakobranchus ocellatus]